MKKLALIATLLLSPLSTTAQENPLVLPITMPCNDSTTVLKILNEQFQEEPVGLGNGSVYGPGGTPRPGQILFWQNNETSTFTVTFTPQNTDLMCFITSGRDIQFLSSVLGDSI